MADVDPKIASLASRLVESSNPRSRTRHDTDSDEDDEALFAELEAEIENDGSAAMREHGLEALRQEMDRVKQMKENEHGRYVEITDEKQVIRATANEPRCVVHFFHPNFQRCAVMDKHLAKLAPKYFATRFVRVFVENIPWVVERLSIKVLPCVICFVNGVTKDRIIGFEELGNNDDFETKTLEVRLSTSGVIQQTTGGHIPTLYKVSSGKIPSYGDGHGDDFDLDD